MGIQRMDNGHSLYDATLLQQIDFNLSTANFSPRISATEPGEPWLLVRPLSSDDYDKGFIQLLSQLTTVGNITKEDFLRRFYEMKTQGGYYVTVIEDTRIAKVIGTASLVVERKFIHNCGLRARLEDVVVNDTYRGKQLGKLIVVTVTLLSRVLGCYKMSLDCKDRLIPYYKSLGYELEPGNHNTMMLRHNDTPS